MADLPLGVEIFHIVDVTLAWLKSNIIIVITLLKLLQLNLAH